MSDHSNINHSNNHPDILVIGGGIIGLAIALELRQRGAGVTVLNRDWQQAAGHAAAGMLAPQAEQLIHPAMQQLCLQSRDRYGEWIQKLETLTGVDTGYWPCGILAPHYDDVSATQIAQRQQAEPMAHWLDEIALQHHQPGLSPEVTGAWWFPDDAQVDNRALMQALRTAVQEVGVDFREGIQVDAIQQRQGHVVGVRTSVGEFQADHYVLATGAWSSSLLPVPVTPVKGQMLLLRQPNYAHTLPQLRQILFGQEIYIVPRQDGRIVLGATVESAGFTPGNTPQGVNQLLAAAMRLYPHLSHQPIQDMWWGFRPSTPDELPILGSSRCDNLSVAVGHHRNGILLAPITAALLTNHILGTLDNAAQTLLNAFSWQRFYSTLATSQSRSQLVSPSNRQQLAVAPPLNPETPQRTNSSTDAQTYTAMQTLHPATTQATELTNASTLNALDQPLVIANRTFRSRLMTGTGKYRSLAEMQQSIAASGCEIVTVAVRRVQTNAPGHEGLAEAIDWSKIWMLPNTAGCKTAEEAIRVARLGREMAKLLGQEDNNFIKLEVIPDAKYLLPDPIGTLQAAEQLVKEGFAVLPYVNADPLLAKRLEEAGCATVMPLGSPIGSGQGIRNAANIQIIIENAQIPIVVDAGIGTPSEAAQAMELGADALLINTAIAQAKNPPAMARAMGMATEAGRLAYLAGRIPVKGYASASSPLTGTITDTVTE
ncbi:MAG: glycine oxidase ThiO [Thainema sp.]